MIVAFRASRLFCFAILLLGIQANFGTAGEPVRPVMSVSLADVLPESDFDESIQTPEQFFGFPLGSRHLRHHQLVDYGRYLAEASGRVQYVPYGTTHGGRPLFVLLVTRNADQINLERLKDERRKLVDGSSDVLDNATFETTKTVAYAGYTIHGDEASGANAFPAVAYYLAAGSDPLVKATLDKSILLLDPCLNPDGSDRFANWVNETRGRFPTGHEADREHVQPWPRGRTNYYWFDLNRDWLPTVHPESRGRIALFHAWKPNLVLDFHEMGSSSSYFFQPGIPERNNPLTPDAVFQLTKKFAAVHASTLDAADQLYFTEERFDDFYMGKGSTYPDLHGAIGILFEQGSTRALLAKNERYTRSFAETVANQIRTSLSSFRSLDNLHDDLLKHQQKFYVDALTMASKADVRAYVLHADGDKSRVAAAVELLRRHDLKVWQPADKVTIDGREFAPGTIAIIPTNQPEYRFLQSLMQREQQFKENIFYDVSTWTLPLAFDLQVIEHRSDLPETWQTTPSEVVETEEEFNEPFAFAIDPVSLDAPRVVSRLLGEGIEIRVAYEPFEATNMEGNAVEFVRGTWLVLGPMNRKNWGRVVEIMGEEKEAVRAELLESGLTTAGPDLGSDANRVVPKPEMLLVVGAGTTSLDSGALWYFLDHRMELPATLVDTDNFSGVDLEGFSCVILPAGSYETWSSATSEKLRTYVSNGGTVVAIDAAIGWLQSQGLVSRGEATALAKQDSASEATQPMKFADASDRAALEQIAGAIFSTKADVTHPLAFGFPRETIPVFRDTTSQYPLLANPLATAAIYAEVEAGYVSQRNRERLRGTAAVWAQNVGSGRIICLADNPVFRGYFRASERFLTNAILIGPTLRIPSSGPRESVDEHHH
jgi:hypothetical protein